MADYVLYLPIRVIRSTCPVLLYPCLVDLSSMRENRQNTGIICYSDLTIRSECLADCLPHLDLNLHAFYAYHDLFVGFDAWPIQSIPYRL